MKFRALTSYVLLSTMVLLLLSTAAQANEYREENTEVKAEEILKHIENSDGIYLDNCSVVGELDISKIKLKTVTNSHFNQLLNEGYDKEFLIFSGLEENSIVESNITIQSSIFENDVNLSNVLFKNPIDFSYVNFNKSVNFIGTNFNGSANFSEAKFNDYADFEFTEFNDYYDFTGTKFNDYYDFTGLEISNYREIKAEDILKQIENGEDVNIICCRIVGELDLDDIELETVPNPKYQEILEYFSDGTLPEDEISTEENISVISTDAGIFAFTGYDDEGWCFEPIEVIQPKVSKKLKVVESNITMDNCILENDLDFSYSLFKKPLSFNGVEYSSNATFTGSYFNNLTCFMDNTFTNAEDFSFTTLNDNTSFLFTTFNDSADFFCVTFNSTTDFQDAIFNNTAHFCSATFKDANFCGGTFKGAADFSSATFNVTNFAESTFEDVVFWDATFNDVSFSSTTFKDAGFYNSTFKNIDLMNTTFKGDIDFSDAVFENITDMSYTNFNKAAYVSGSDTPENIILNGESSQIFIESYKKEGRYDDADTVYYIYRKGAQAQKEWGDFSKWIDIICWITCGYGVRPSYTLCLGATLILLFSVIYAKGPAIRLYTDRYGVYSFDFYFKGSGITKRNEDSEIQPQVSFRDALYFSVNTFTTVGNSNWYPKENFKKWTTLEGLLGWTILGIFMATLTAVMIRT